MIPIKTEKELGIIIEAGKRLAQVKSVIRENIKPGVTLFWLDKLAEKEIKKIPGMEPAFKRVYGYKWTTCINLNEGLVHGIPNAAEIEPGDKVSVDIGIWHKGMNTDSAFSVAVDPVSETLQKFIQTGKLTLERAIEKAMTGNRIGHISRTIHESLKSAGYWPSLMFTGHGVGKDLHEEPSIPCYWAGEVQESAVIRPGMVLAIEVIYSEGKPEVEIGSDGWTARLKDGKIGGLFEETVIITENGPVVVTS